MDSADCRRRGDHGGSRYHLCAYSRLEQVDPDGASSITLSDEFVDSYKIDDEVARLDKIAQSASQGR
ncbi:hypothetical protein ACU6RU_14160 [Microbacterium sp. F1-18]